MSFRQRLRTVGATGVLLVMLALAACGPGVGGTGTGNGLDAGAVGLAEFGAMASSVCAEPFAPVLGCEPVVGSGIGELGRERLFTGTCAVAAFEGDVVELDVVCEGLYFSGRWGVDGEGRSRYFGLVGADPMLVASEPATLEVTASGDVLVLTLRSASGEVLAGPLPLTAAAP